MSDNKSVNLSTIIHYGLPATGIGFMMFLGSVYLMKYSTDVLSISPLIIGGIVFISRILDAITDPLVGYYSDKSTSKMGRRRPWILASSIPIFIFFYMMWCPPAVLSGYLLILWMGTGVILFYTAATLFIIPHFSLGAELSDSYHVRTKIFGFRHGFDQLGYLLAVAVGYFLFQASNPSELMTSITLLGGGTVAITIIIMVVFVKEAPASHKIKREKSPYQSYKNVFANKYALRLVIVYLFEITGMIFASSFTPYISEYILKTPDQTSLYLLIYMAGSFLGIPIWVYLSRYFGKKKLLFYALNFLGLTFGSAIFLQEGSIIHMYVILFLLGIGAGSPGVLVVSIQADIIDYGECLTGKRTEGAYFAVWNFAMKSATGITFLLVGIILETSSFIPNIDQSDATKLWMLIGFSAIPALCYLIAAGIFKGFNLDEQQYLRIRKILDYRKIKLGVI